MAKMMSVEDFRSNLVPSLINGKERFGISFSTYNEVSGHRSGPVETRDDNLNIVVTNGGVTHDPFFMLGFGMALAVGDDEASASFSQTARNYSDDGQRKVAKELTEKKLAADALVIYAGLLAFDQVLSGMQDLRKSAPESHISVLTCDCDLGRKLPKLRAERAIDTIVVTHQCGGRGVMANILESFIEQWPNRVPPQK